MPALAATSGGQSSSMVKGTPSNSFLVFVSGKLVTQRVLWGSVLLNLVQPQAYYDPKPYKIPYKLSVSGSMIEQAIIGTISVLLSALVTYAIVKYSTRDEAILDKIEVIFDAMSSSPELQQKIYTIGGILGSGIARGAGLQKAAGKRGIEGMIVELLGSYFLKGRMPESQPQQAIEPYQKTDWGR
jgi:hypothetical protein